MRGGYTHGKKSVSQMPSGLRTATIKYNDGRHEAISFEPGEFYKVAAIIEYPSARIDEIIIYNWFDTPLTFRRRGLASDNQINAPQHSNGVREHG